MYIRILYEEAKHNTGAVPIRRVARCMFLPTLHAGSTAEPHQTCQLAYCKRPNDL
jgi:hypothetical protein